ARRGQHRVLSAVHGRRPRMVLKPGDGHFPLFDPDDSFDDADVQCFTLEVAALFYVQFQVRGDVSALPSDGRDLRRISAEEGDAVGDALATPRRVVQLRRGELATHRPTAVQATLFVGPDHD